MKLVTLCVEWRWWVPLYLQTLVMLCTLCGTHPDIDKVVAFMVRRGLKIVKP